MTESLAIDTVVIDYGLGNLFSVLRALEASGASPRLSHDSADIQSADLILLPGVGAFGQAMENLRSLNLVDSIRDRAQRGKPIVGICLGMQLMMSDSEEFGSHKGLGLIDGSVRQFQSAPGIKVPHVGWAALNPPLPSSGRDTHWQNGPLTGISYSEYMYFVHSYYVEPLDTPPLTVSTYGGQSFCSSIQVDNLIGFQFHPERSGPAGLRIYRNLIQQISSTK